MSHQMKRTARVGRTSLPKLDLLLCVGIGAVWVMWYFLVFEHVGAIDVI